MLKGADVSSYQGYTREYMDLLHSKGYKFLGVKTTQANYYVNPYATAQLSNGHAVFGHQATFAYHYLTGDVDVRTQAGYFLNFVKHNAVLDKKSWLALDVEDNSLVGKTMSYVNTFLDAVYKAGFTHLIVYGSASWFQTKAIDKAKLVHKPLIWVASYGTSQPGVDGTDIWQYDGTGSLDQDLAFDNSIFNVSEDKPVKVASHYYQKGTKFQVRIKVNQYDDKHLKHKTGVVRGKGYLIYGHIVLDGKYPRIKTSHGNYYSASVANVKRLN